MVCLLFIWQPPGKAWTFCPAVARLCNAQGAPHIALLYACRATPLRVVPGVSTGAAPLTFRTAPTRRVQPGRPTSRLAAAWATCQAHLRGPLKVGRPACKPRTLPRPPSPAGRTCMAPAASGLTLRVATRLPTLKGWVPRAMQSASTTMCAWCALTSSAECALGHVVCLCAHCV